MYLHEIEILRIHFYLVVWVPWIIIFMGYMLPEVKAQGEDYHNNLLKWHIASVHQLVYCSSKNVYSKKKGKYIFLIIILIFLNSNMDTLTYTLIRLEADLWKEFSERSFCISSICSNLVSLKSRFWMKNDFFYIF